MRLRKHYTFFYQEFGSKKISKKGREADNPTAIHTLISCLIDFCINTIHEKHVLLFHIVEGAAK